MVALGGCQTPAQITRAPLSGAWLCQYTESQFGYLLDFDRPDIVDWGGIVPVSYRDGIPGLPETDGGRVEKTTPSQRNALGQLTYQRAEYAQTYTVIRTGAQELRLLVEPRRYDPAEVGSDPVPRCKPYPEWAG
ncbi:MAG: hypothetical protein ACOH2M_29415 [Cypionkella sp.]